MVQKYSIIIYNYLYIIIFSCAGVYFFYSIGNLTPQELAFIQKFGFDAYLISIPTFAMWLFVEQFIREKFADEKLLKRFEALLTNPISLKQVWEGKLLSIFLLSYPMVIINIIIFFGAKTIFETVNSFTMPSIVTWILIIFITPMFPLIYAGFMGWFILRFKNWKRFIGLLPMLLFGIFFGVVLLFIKLMESGSIKISNISLNSILIFGILVLSIFWVMIFSLVSRLDKEKVL